MRLLFGPAGCGWRSASLYVGFWVGLSIVLFSSRAHSGSADLFSEERFIVSRSGAMRDPTGMKCVDFDGDGDIDVVASGAEEDQVSWFENDGRRPPVFIPHVITIDPNIVWFEPQGLADGASSVDVADVDGDGDLDVIATAAAANLVLWFERDSASPPNFTPHAIFDSAIGAAVAVAADIDGDGDIDIISGSSGDGTVRWHENDGADNPTFTTQSLITTAVDPRIIQVLDLDGDLDFDLVVGSSGDNTIAWLENNGAADPIFTRSVISTTSTDVRAIAISDVDGDGVVSLLAAVPNGIQVFNSDGLADPTFSFVGVIPANDPRGITATHFDGDSEIDIVYSEGALNRVVWLENGPLFSTHVANVTLLGASDVHVADIDGDGKRDIVAIAADDEKIAWLEIGASPTEFRERHISTTAWGPLTIHSGDLDGDGDTDIAVASHLDDKVFWLENDGRVPPSFYSHTVSISAVRSESIHTADVDNDGDLDIIGSSVDDNKVSWYINDGAVFPNFNEVILSTNALHAESVWADDIDGDGDLDLLSASSLDDKIAWYENDPLTFPILTEHIITVDPDEAGTGLEGEANGVLTVRSADVDGDGDVDVLGASFFDDRITLWENQGGDPPVFALHVVPTMGLNGRSVIAGDIDGDGDIDLASAMFWKNILWQENLGGMPPVFNPRLISNDEPLANWVYLGDLDLDGDLDVIGNALSEGRVSWYENSGAATPAFTRHILTSTAVSTWAVHADDLDGDGDLDVIQASFEGDDRVSWFENKLRTPTGNFAADWELYE